jgi:hypothetical protein
VTGHVDVLPTLEITFIINVDFIESHGIVITIRVAGATAYPDLGFVVFLTRRQRDFTPNSDMIAAFFYILSNSFFTIIESFDAV